MKDERGKKIAKFARENCNLDFFKVYSEDRKNYRRIKIYNIINNTPISRYQKDKLINFCKELGGFDAEFVTYENIPFLVFTRNFIVKLPLWEDVKGE